MELQGIHALFLGDSITESYGPSKPENSYHARLAAKYGMRTENYGVSGSRFARQTTFGLCTCPRADVDFCYRAENEMSACAPDLVTVFGGTNDYGHGDAPLGTPDDRTPDSFFGACHTLFSTLIKKYPTARIVVMTPLHRRGESSPFGEGGNRKPTPVGSLSVYVDIIRQVAKMYSLPVLDLYEGSGICPDDEENCRAYTIDGLHPNDAGHALIAARLEEFLLAL